MLWILTACSTGHTPLNLCIVHSILVNMFLFALCLALSLGPVALCTLIVSRQTVFKHPGIFISSSHIDFTKSKLGAKADPWTSAYKAMDSVAWAKTTWKASPVATVRCEDPGTPEYSLEKGCKEERNDALAAYSMALRWSYTKDVQFAKKAIEILDAWSGTLKGHVGTSSPEQVGLQSGWAGSTWARAAEIIKHTGAGWTSASVTRFEGMLRDVYLPQVRNGSAANPNNIDSAMLEASQSIAVFLDDNTLYKSVMVRAKQHIRSYIYLSTDGALPVTPSWSNYQTESRVKLLWQNDASFFEGRTQETCRDLEHASYGLASISHIMDTAYIQGDDMYSGEFGTRLQRALEVHAPYAKGGSVPSTICKGTLKYTLLPVAEPGYSALVGRLGKSMPKTKAIVEGSRPAKSNSLFTAWETLSHAG